ncbi:MAG TPA: AbrB/MazE/SpoVT family DNA-binding domain-containing protein [Verrucomicrobiae bacterium]|nr:AbrB/MazE/SpoVT family DNA-binding domain-containing protein [Verrucomicrobiae bacterium]
MIYTSRITSKGTTTIPADIREKLGLKPGSEVRFEEDAKTGAITLEPMPSIEEVRSMNQALLKKLGTTDILKNYKAGDGFAAHVKEKYGDISKS